MQATYSATCPRCQVPIRRGDEIIRPNIGQNYIHVTCLRVSEAPLFGYVATLTRRVG